MKKLTDLFKNNHFFRGSFVMVGGGMLANALNYAYHLFMGRLLGPTDYGTLASIFSVLYIISIVPLSSSFAIVKFISHAKDKKSQNAVYLGIKSFVLKIAIGGFVVIIILSPVIASFLHIKEFVSVVLVAPILFLSLVILIDQAAMQGVLKFGGVVIPN